jgi:hypothetical protein
MENCRTVAIPSSRYNEFLFTVICEEPNGTQLSVLSALTRVDIDPWEEAARLSAADPRWSPSGRRAHLAQPGRVVMHLPFALRA